MLFYHNLTSAKKEHLIPARKRIWVYGVCAKIARNTYIEISTVAKSKCRGKTR
jgi:hypothetical protein